MQLNGFPKHARKIDKNWLFNNLSIYNWNEQITPWKIFCTIFHSLVELYQKTQLVNKNHTRAFSIE